MENPLSTKLLSGEFSQGDRIIVDLGDKGLTFSVERRADVGAQLGNSWHGSN